MADTKELLSKIARLKDSMEAETDAEMKERFRSKIDSLQKQVDDAEKAVEKQEAKVEKQEDKAMEEAEKKLQRFQDAMDAETDPDIKAKFKKKIEDLEKQLKGVKEQIAEEKKEIQEQKKEIEKASKEVESAEKQVRKQAIKKAEKQVESRQKVAGQKKKRKKEIENIIARLAELIDRNPRLREKYSNARGGSYSQYPMVDLKRDAGRASKPFGYRFKGKGNNRVPRADQRDQSNVYYEGRANRADVFPRRREKLDDGGELMAIKVGDKVKYKGAEYIATVEEVFNVKPLPYATIRWVDDNAKKKEESAYLADLEKVDVRVAEEYVNPEMADGGMAKSGKLYFVRFDTGDVLTGTTARGATKEEAIENARKSLKLGDEKVIAVAEINKKNGVPFADGGMAGHGKRVRKKIPTEVVLNVYKTAKEWKMNMPEVTEFDDVKSAKKAGEKAEAFEYEVVDSLTGETLYSTYVETGEHKYAYKKGGEAGKKQGYDDREDESLAARRGKTESKDLKGTKKEKEKSRRDDAGFEKRKIGRKKHIYSWKPEAEGKVPKSALDKAPTAYYAKKFPKLVVVDKK